MIRPTRDAGFTLVEVLVAMAIAAGVSAGAAVLVSTAALHAHQSRIRTVATMLAVQKMEQLTPRSQRGATPTPGGSTETSVPGFFDVPDLSRGRASGPGSATSSYTRRWSISAQSDGTCLLRVSVFMSHMAVVSPARLMTIACRGGS